MPAYENYQPQGVIPACLMPFDAELRMDEAAYRSHIRDLAAVKGVTAVTLNGHAAEVHALDPHEQREAVRIAREELGTVRSIVGIFTNSSRDAAMLARAAQAEGADALLVFPPDALNLGGHLRPASMIEHLRWITEASDLPIVLFQLPLASNLSFPIDQLVELCERFPQIRAIKDQYGDGKVHERHIRTMGALTRPVNVLTTHSGWLLGSLAMGCQGLLSGAGSVIADLQVALFEAVQAGDLRQARAVNDRIYPTVRAFYEAPIFDQHNRMKEALVLLGRLDAAYVRPPLVKIEAREIERITAHLAEAGLSRETVYAGLARAA